jgi:hypothetical protein
VLEGSLQDHCGSIGASTSPQERPQETARGEELAEDDWWFAFARERRQSRGRFCCDDCYRELLQYSV